MSPDSSISSASIPVTILSGFLGAGKTTLLNRFIAATPNQRIAVIENEFGTVGIDSKLITKNADVTVVELANGCVCCSVRGELSKALQDLADRRERGELPFDRLILETTGLADPAPVAQAFFVDEGVRDRYTLDGILTLVDVVHANAQLNEHRIAAAQVGFADRLLLSKTDLVKPEEVDKLKARLQQINVRAVIEPSPTDSAAVKALLQLEAFHLNEALNVNPTFLHPEPEHPKHSHGHHAKKSWSDDISSLVLRHAGEVDLERIGQFVEQLIDAKGNDLLRYKGVLAVRNKPERLIFQGVHRITGFDNGRAWEPQETKESIIVLIGRSLDRETLTKSFQSTFTV